MSEENIRTYTFNVPSFIPGVPRETLWPVGSWAIVNEDTKEVLDFGPKPASPPALLTPENIEQAMNTPIFEDGPKLEGVPPIMQVGG